MLCETNQQLRCSVALFFNWERQWVKMLNKNVDTMSQKNDF